MTIVGTPILIFKDRREAGRRLADQLRSYADGRDVVVLGLPRGGVPIAREVATTLHVPMDIFVARKVGVPGHHELAMGAVASGGVVVMNADTMRCFRISQEQFEVRVQEEWKEVDRREKLYRAGQRPISIAGKTVILVDDGLATGSTILAAIAALRQHRPTRILVAVPVAPRETCDKLAKEACDVIVLTSPHDFHAVGQVYDDFNPVDDAEVVAIMKNALQPASRDVTG